MKYCAFALITILFSVNSSIYSYTITDVDGNQVSLDSFQHKKILFVNIATGSPYASQLAQLQQLQQQYADSLIVIGFPSNSFDNESRTNAQIKSFCQSSYGVSFLLAAKGSVTGGNIQSVYQWLTRQTENGQINTSIQGDFQKYVVDRNGELRGVFKGMVSPLDTQITSLITGSFN
jgi:glutathione peroxidase